MRSLARKRFIARRVRGNPIRLDRGFNSSVSEYVRLLTGVGEIVAEIFIGRAPKSANAFLFYVDEGLFENASFVRSVRKDNDVGSPQIEIIQASVYPHVAQHVAVEHEDTAMTGVLHLDGTLSLGRGELGTGSPSSFFICIGEQPGLDFGGKRARDGAGFAAFGRVIEGFSVVREIHGRDTLVETPDPYFRGQILAEPVAIRAARRERSHV